MKLSPSQVNALEAMMDALFPSIIKENDTTGYWKRKGSDFDMVSFMEETINIMPEENIKLFKQLVNLLDSRMLGLTWFGPLKKAQHLSLSQREKLLQTWAKSSLLQIRQSFITLKKLGAFLYYGARFNEKDNPNWAAVQYPGPLTQSAPDPSDFEVEEITKDCTITTEVLIIGSGAGGGVIAAQLAEAGQEVLVVEKGPYLKKHEMNHTEFDMIQQLYERRGALASEDGGVSVLAGSCVGGGTTVNWAGMFRTPDYILEEWGTEHGNAHFLDAAYHKGFDFIEKRTNTHIEPVVHNAQNQALLTGAEKLKYKASIIPRNYRTNENIDRNSMHFKAQGYSLFGDNQGDKQGTQFSFLKDAISHGAKILAYTEVEKIEIKASEAVGAFAVYKKGGNTFHVHIKAKRVIVAAGAIHSPALLMRSGLRHPQIGKNLYLHPVNAVAGVYKEKMEAWYGPMMSAVCDEFTKQDGNFGCKIETPPVHSGFMALALPWFSGKQFKEDMLKIANLGLFIVLTRDKYGGQIKLSKKGKKPLLHYKLNPYDRQHLIKGMQESVKMHAEAGAEEIKILHNSPLSFNPQKGNLDQFLKQMAQLKWDTNRFILFSAHQMGTCRMGGNANGYPLKPNGETREVRNLFVADASAFPKCSGANPMLSIMALSYYIAQGLK